MEIKEKEDLEFEEILEMHPNIDKYNIKPGVGALYELKKNKKDKKEIIQFKLLSKESISHDVKIFTFELPEDQNLGLSAGNHISISYTKIKVNSEIGQELEEEVSRKYTPISPISKKGSFQLLIKIYKKNVDPLFPEGGVLTQWLDEQDIGTYINFRGPLGKFNYYGNGYFRLGFKPKPLRYVTKQFNKVAMIAGGTGIAPIYHILQEAFLNDENLEFYLIYSNRKEDDILLRETIYYMSKKSRAYSESERLDFDTQFSKSKNEDRRILDYVFKNGEENIKKNFFLKFYNILTRSNDLKSDYYNGKINEDLIKTLLPSPEEKTLILLCGRGKMCKKLLTPILLNMGHQTDNVFTF